MNTCFSHICRASVDNKCARYQEVIHNNRGRDTITHALDRQPNAAASNHPFLDGNIKL